MRTTDTSHMISHAALASLELCTWFLLAFCCIVFALQSTSGPRCTHRSRRCRMPTRAPLTTWGASSRNRENLAASVVIRDQWERRSPAVRRGPAAYRQLDQGAASHRTKQRPSAMARPRSTPRRAGQAPGGVLAGPRPPARRDGSWDGNILLCYSGQPTPIPRPQPSLRPPPLLRRRECRVPQPSAPCMQESEIYGYPPGYTRSPSCCTGAASLLPPPTIFASPPPRVPMRRAVAASAS